jgi:hypothetical protein
MRVYHSVTQTRKTEPGKSPAWSDENTSSLPSVVQDMPSDTVRQAAIVWWSEVMSTRLNDPKTGAKVVVMQRVHQQDLAGHLLEQGGYERSHFLCTFDEPRFAAKRW